MLCVIQMALMEFEVSGDDENFPNSTQYRSTADLLFLITVDTKAFLMPLVIFSGLPCSGKTTRALQLQKALEIKIASAPRKFKIHVLNDDNLGINREVYRGAFHLIPS
jgi:Chromatin associated protein KTI12